jgi:hypothetical protein
MVGYVQDFAIFLEKKKKKKEQQQENIQFKGSLRRTKHCSC